MRNSEHNGLFYCEFVRNKVFVIAVLKAESLIPASGDNFQRNVTPRGVTHSEILLYIYIYNFTLKKCFFKLLVTLCE